MAQNFISDIGSKGDFPIVSQQTATAIYTDINDDWLFKKPLLFFKLTLKK